MGLSSWDMAAGALLVKEAGGLVGDFEGGERYLDSGNIVAGNPRTFKAVLQIVGSKTKAS
jgi:myo-inositol-1(or 4)-monophosphatase